MPGDEEFRGATRGAKRGELTGAHIGIAAKLCVLGCFEGMISKTKTILLVMKSANPVIKQTIKQTPTQPPDKAL